MEVSIKRRKDDIVGVATKVKRQVLYVRATGILNGKSEVKIEDEIRDTYECVIKIALFLNIFVALFI